MKIFVTGGTGFVGSHLVEALLAGGHEVWALVRNPKSSAWLTDLPVRMLKGDLFSIPPLPRDLEAVFHLAGLAKSTRISRYYSVNSLGTASLLDALARQRLKPRVVYVSTISAGGPSSEGCLRREDEPPSPVSPYGRSKLLAEQAVLRSRHDVPVTILRPGIIFGPRDHDLAEILKWIKRGILPFLKGRKIRVSCIYIKDFVTLLLRCLAVPPRSGEIYHAAASPAVDFDDFGNEAAVILGKDPFRIGVSLKTVRWFSLASEVLCRATGLRPTLNSSFAADMNCGSWAVDTTKAKRELSFEPVTPFRKALEETIRWYRNAGWI